MRARHVFFLAGALDLVILKNSFVSKGEGDLPSFFFSGEESRPPSFPFNPLPRKKEAPSLSPFFFFSPLFKEVTFLSP